MIMQAGIRSLAERVSRSVTERYIRQASRIKAFVDRHGEPSAKILRKAAIVTFDDPQLYMAYLLTEPLGNEPSEACKIVRALGRDAAMTLPDLIRLYFDGRKTGGFFDSKC